MFKEMLLLCLLCNVASYQAFPEDEQSRLHNIEAKLQQLTTTVQNLRQENFWLKQQQKKQDKDAKLSMNNLVNDMNQIKQENSYMKQEIKRLKDDVGHVIPDEKNQNSIVAFTACVNTIREYNEGDQVLFDFMRLNEGNGFNVTTSNFTCPFSGHYVFFLAIKPQADSVMKAIITKDSSNLVRIIGSSTSGNFDQNSNLVITHCEIGQTVWVKAHQNDNMVLDGATVCTTSFSGYLLRINTN